MQVARIAYCGICVIMLELLIMSGAEFDSPFQDPGDFHSSELVAQAMRIEGLGSQLLENPDWEQMQLHYEVPFGPNGRLELLARTSSAMVNNEDFRNITIWLDHQ